jgi:hypothetical protein
MATGSYATTLIRPSDSPHLNPALRTPSTSRSTSTPPPPRPAVGPLRKRRRINNDTPETEEKEEKEERRGRKETRQGGSLEKVVRQLARSRRNVLQQAIALLEEEYPNKLSSEHMDMALDCLENEAKSSIFISIQDVDRRDRWLERHAGIEILYE